MGNYVNPVAKQFRLDRNGAIYVDKSMIIDQLNRVIDTPQRFVCISRPRRFGKTMAADMIAAYYGREGNAEKEFSGLKITHAASFSIFRNRFDVIKINMQEVLSRTKSIEELLDRLQRLIMRELLQIYPDVDYFDPSDLIESMKDIYGTADRSAVLVIDEWDCIFREYPHDSKAQRSYLDFLRDWMKDKSYISLAYMTGILPIKKYGTHSALNMFREFSMEDPGEFAEFVGFTEEEVTRLCRQYQMDLDECRSWYNGYRFPRCDAVYGPNSIVEAMTSKFYKDYWNKTETYEALGSYIDLNFDGLRDAILGLMSGDRRKIDVGSFQNDMTSFSCADDVLTLLVHLGYLGYDALTGEAFIPNREIMMEFVRATTKGSPWDEIVRAVRESESLLQATWQMDEQAVAAYVEIAHLETSHLQYNDENALSYTISLAYYAARQYYTLIRELPAGKGFADLAFVPRQKYSDQPAMLIELKWNQSADTAICQIKERKYPLALREYRKNLLIVGISYDRTTRKHECRIERITE